MSRLVTKQVKKVKLDEKGKDYVIIRPLTRDEMLEISSIFEETPMLNEYLMQVRQLLDRDPNKEIEKIVNEHLEKIKAYEEKKTKINLRYNDMLVKKSIVEIYDDGKKYKGSIDSYISAIDNVTYQKIVNGILAINIPTKEKVDFLE